MKGGIIMFDEEYFSMQEKINLKKQELSDAVDNTVGSVVQRLLEIIKNGNPDRINMVREFIWISLDGPRHSKLRDEIENSKTLTVKEKGALIDSYFNHR